MIHHKKLINSDAELLLTYQTERSVHRVGKIYGISGDAVHKRIRNMPGFRTRHPEFTEDEVERIKEYYKTTPEQFFDLSDLASEFGKSKQNICRKARRIGLSNKYRIPNSKTIEKYKNRKWKPGTHPRGMAGKNHSMSTKERLSVISKNRWITWKESGTGLMTPESRAATSRRVSLEQAKRRANKNYTWANGGHRKDLAGVYCRSAWEANYARYLNLLIRMKVVENWEFEPETFWFENIKRGTRSFLIDFRVKYTNETEPVYVEVKGYMDKRSKTKISRFRKYYPQHRLEVVGSKEYYCIRDRWSSAIPDWEFPKKKGAAG